MVERLLDDGWIQEQVLEELRSDPAVEPTDVGVEVDNGVVTLTGTVESYAMKAAAERAAHRVLGLKAVANDLQVVLPSGRTPTDTDIATAAADALEADGRVPHERIKVTVRHGWVTLEGSIDWHYQKGAAERAVRDLTGVEGVLNLIAVGAPQVAAEEVKSKIEEALKRRAESHAGCIEVEVQDGEVILNGIVHASFEREEAEKAAWSTEGVSAVENRITVAPSLANS